MHQPHGRMFETRDTLEQWLKENHSTERELWVRVFKKHSGRTSVTWNDCVVAGIAWGWIDSQRKSLDEVSFLQRMTPRRPKSNWSKKNCKHAEHLIAEGRMQPSGLECVQSARDDGRWDRAYSGSAEMVIPDDFLRELKKNPIATRFYAGLNRKSLFRIYGRIHVAKSVARRKEVIANTIAKLAMGQEV